MPHTPFLHIEKTVNGQEGQLFAWMPNEAGVIEQVNLFHCKDIVANMNINMTSLRVLGYLGEQEKPTGWKGTGSLTLYYGTHHWTRLLEYYKTTGILPPLTVLMINDDPNVTDRFGNVVRQQLQLRGVMIGGGLLGALNVNSQVLESPFPFSFRDFHYIESYAAAWYRDMDFVAGT